MTTKHSAKFMVNGDLVELEVHEHWTLLRVLREELDLTGAKPGCGEGECGACTVLVDGMAVNSCIYPVMEVVGREISRSKGFLAARATRCTRSSRHSWKRPGSNAGFARQG